MGNLVSLPGTLLIRPSSLPGANDCLRRTIARLFPGLVAAAGFELRTVEPHIGGPVGTACHTGASDLLRAKMDTGEPGNIGDAVDHGISDFETEIAAGVVWDKVTGDRGTAQRQIARMVGAYARHRAPTVDPIAVEERLDCDLGDGFYLSGQSDSVVREPGGINDLKTGKVRRSCATQLGSYSLTQRSRGRPIERLTEDFLPRVSLKKEQAPPTSFFYDVEAAEHEAWETINQLKASVTEFQRRLATGDAPPEMAFRANPQSMLCSDVFCPAWGTRWCRVHLNKEE